MKTWAMILGAALLWSANSADVTKGEFGAARDAERIEKVERKSAATSKSPTYPFYGTLDSADVKEKPVTLRGKKKTRVILFTSETRVQKDGTYAKIEDLVSGERVSGSVRKNVQGKEEAVTIRSAPAKTRVGKSLINVN
jgi:hypothetical protein